MTSRDDSGAIGTLAHLVDAAVAAADELDDELRSLLTPPPDSRTIAGWPMPDRFVQRRLARRRLDDRRRARLQEQCHELSAAVMRVSEVTIPAEIPTVQPMSEASIATSHGLADGVGRGPMVQWALSLHSRVLDVAGELRRVQTRLFLYGERQRTSAGAVAEPVHVDEFVLSTDPTDVDLDVLHRYLSETAYWALGRSRKTVERSVAGSYLVVAALDAGGRMVGFGRIVSDGATFGWLADVFVLPDVQGRGLGTAIVQLAVDHPDLRSIKRMVLGTADAHDLYERFGFVALPEPGRWMMRPGPEVEG